jgi:PAS domain S-box-containing protein
MFLIETESMRVMDANPAACAFYGWGPDDFLKKRLTDINTLPEPEIREVISDILNHERRRFHARHRLASGEERDVEVNSMPYRLEERQCLLSIIHDITSQVVAEQELELIRQQTVQELVQARDEWVRTFNAVPDLITILDTDYRIVRVNRTMAEKLGMSPEEVAGKRCYEFVHGTMEPPVFCPNSNLLKDHLEHVGEVYEEQLGGWFHVTVTPIYDSEGQFTGSVHVARDINKRVRAEELLRESEERYRLISELTSDFVYSCRRSGDSPYKIDWIAGAIETISGYSLREIEELRCWLPYVHEEDRERSYDMLHGIRPGDATEWECRLVARSGEVRWLRNHAACTSGDNGTLILYGAAQDITVRKLAQERILASLREKEMLLKEIHHRVKNNLQIISSLLNLQMAHIDDKKLIPLFRKSQNRVRTMALIHEKLYRSDNLAYIDFGAYLRDLANSLFRSYHTSASRARLDIDAEPITFGIDTAVPCGLLLNELVSNALKYAFPDGREGTVRIELHQNDEKTCTLIVADTGVGLPDGFDIQQTETLGMELIRSLAKQLDGTLEVGNDGGARFVITFKRQD